MSGILKVMRYLTVPGDVYVRFAHIRVGPHGFNLFYLLEWAVALVLLLAFTFSSTKRTRPPFLNTLRHLAKRRWLAVLLVSLLSIVGRLALLTIEPFPAPAVHDEFSYLLAADTFAHLHAASPTPLDVKSFEAFHVLMQPTYASMYPPASGLFYGFGQAVFGTPRAGLLLLMALACGSLCWMLQAFLPPEWALLGGIIAVFHISWFSYFGNTFWGGAAAMLGGCLLLGAAGRLLRTRDKKVFPFISLSVALLLLLNTRPFEGGLLFIPLLIVLSRNGSVRRALFSKSAISALVILITGIALSVLYVFNVTHSAKLPWSLQRAQWAITPPFLFQPASYAHTYAFKDQADLHAGYELHDYLEQQQARGYLLVVFNKFFREWVFFISPALTACFLLGILPTLRSRKGRLAAIPLLLLLLIFFIETWVQPQYLAVATGVFYLIFMNGLRQSIALRGRNRLGSAVFGATCISLMVLFCLRLVFIPLVPWPQTWASRGAEMLTRQKLETWLQKRPGNQLVLVRYGPDHRWQDSWIDNGANIASQKVLWARDIPNGNRQLLCDYSNREVWRLTPPEGEEFTPDSTDPLRTSNVSGLLIRVNPPGAAYCSQ